MKKIEKIAQNYLTISMKILDMDKLLRRKVDSYLMAWKNNPDRKPLIIKGARQIGKTESVSKGRLCFFLC